MARTKQLMSAVFILLASATSHASEYRDPLEVRLFESHDLQKSDLDERHLYPVFVVSEDRNIDENKADLMPRNKMTAHQTHLPAGDFYRTKYAK